GACYQKLGPGILLRLGLKLVNPLGHFARTDYQQTRGQGVQRARMTHFQAGISRVLLQLAAYFIHHIKRSPLEWLVEKQYFASFEVKIHSSDNLQINSRGIQSQDQQTHGDPVVSEHFESVSRKIGNK